MDAELRQEGVAGRNVEDEFQMEHGGAQIAAVAILHEMVLVIRNT